MKNKDTTLTKKNHYSLGVFKTIFFEAEYNWKAKARFIRRVLLKGSLFRG